MLTIKTNKGIIMIIGGKIINEIMKFTSVILNLNLYCEIPYDAKMATIKLINTDEPVIITEFKNHLLKFVSNNIFMTFSNVT
jgi:hypothetical protein